MKLQWKSIPSSSPIDLISEIFLRLPEKSIVRFRCVSKLWLSITTDPFFINSFETRNPRPSLFFCFKKDDELVVSSIPQHTLTLDPKSRKSYSYSQLPDPYRMKFPEVLDYFSPEASVHGLICFQTSTTASVWNPSTRKFLTLPKPCKSWNDITTVFLLGYDAVEGKHKVIALPFCKHKVCRVITLGSSQESWRIVRTNLKHTPNDFNCFSQCIKSVIYYLADSYEMYPRERVIMRFDVRSEKLDVIQLPSNHYVNRLITYDGRLACVYNNEYNTKKKNGITLSILEDAEENKWSSRDFLTPFHHYDESLQTSFKLIGYTHAGEFVYKPSSLYVDHKSLAALFFDPVRNSFRKFRFQGVAEEDERIYPLYVFPNHIETQMSL